MKNNRNSRKNGSRSNHQNSGDNSGRFTNEHTWNNTPQRNEDEHSNRSTFASDYSRVGDRDYNSYGDTERSNREFNDRAENFGRFTGNYADDNRMNRNGFDDYNRRNDFRLRGEDYDTNNLSEYDDNADYSSARSSNSQRQSDNNLSRDGSSSRRSSGQFRGRGPKGYQRSDDRIKEDINDRLTDDGQLDASEIEVTVEKGEVTLSGSVSERSDKRRAEDIAESISGVNNVENRIRVARGSTEQQNEKSETKNNRAKHTSEAH